MSFIEEAGEDWHKLPTGGKVAVVAVCVGVIGLGLYAAAHRQQSATSAAGSAGALGDSTSGGAGSTDTSDNFPTSTGGTSAGTSTGAGLPSILANMKIWQGTSTGQFFYGPNGPQPGKKNQFSLASLFPTGTTFTNSGKAGQAGTITITEPDGETYTIQSISGTMPKPTPKPPTPKPGKPIGKPVENKPTPAHPGAPKTQSYTVQRGDTLSSIAARLRLKGGWQALYNQNKSTINQTSAAHGNPIPGGAQNNIFVGEKLNIGGLK
jgi:LysM repeat protein